MRCEEDTSTGICYAGGLCALRSLYSAGSLLLRVTQDTAAGGMGISPKANIRSLAAYELARRALRGECEPIFKTLCVLSGFLRGAHRQNKKDTREECPFVLVTRTGIEPMLQP